MRNIINSERLVLRLIENRDAEHFAALANDQDIARMTGSFPFPFPRLSVDFKVMNLRAQKRRGIGNAYAITKTGDDQLIGVADLFREKEGNPWELGYWIGRPYWGLGYVTESCDALIKELEDTLGPQTVTASVFTDNLASMRVLEKLGFVKAGEPTPYFSMARLCKAPSQSFFRPATS